MQIIIYGKLRKSPMSKFYQNNVSLQWADEKNNLTTGFFKINKNHFLSLDFNQLHCHGNSTHLSQNARINATVVNLAKNRCQSINSLKVMVNQAQVLENCVWPPQIKTMYIVNYTSLKMIGVILLYLASCLCSLPHYTRQTPQGFCMLEARVFLRVGK